MIQKDIYIYIYIIQCDIIITGTQECILIQVGNFNPQIDFSNLP